MKWRPPGLHARSGAVSLRFETRAVSRLIAWSALGFVSVAAGGSTRVLGAFVGVSVPIIASSKRVLHKDLIAIGAGLTIGTVGGQPWYPSTPFHLLGIALAMMCVGACLEPRSKPVRSALVALPVAIALSFVLFPPGALDVAIMEHAAADAIRAGSSPWTGLAVLSGAPGAANQVLTGTPYPPLTSIAYAMSDWLSGDPRNIGFILWALLGVSAWQLTSDPARRTLIALSPAIPLMIWTGWTELLTVTFLAGAASARKRPWLSALLLGLALATKQYMIVALPLVIAFRGPRARMQKSVALGVAVALSLTGFAMGTGYLGAIIGAYARLPPRPDAGSLYGVLTLFLADVSMPFWLGPALGLSWAAWNARHGVETLGRVYIATAQSLSVMFLFGTQAFTNYWYLVLMLILIGAAISDRGAPREHGTPGTNSSPAVTPPATL
jgi:hypothetical protein